MPIRTPRAGFSSPRCQSWTRETRFLAVGFASVAVHLRQFVRLVNDATRHMEEHRPNAVVLVDFPGFNWWIATFPGMAIFLTVFAYILIGEAMRDALDPKLRKRD